MTIDASSYYRRQIFNVVNPVSLDVIEKKDRLHVHTDGDWHLAATAFILRERKGYGLEILVQTRSNYVDIARGISDQSLATQLLVEDKENPKQAILRGLREELSLEGDEVKAVVAWNKLGSCMVIKRYKDNPLWWNREIVETYLVTLSDKYTMEPNFKVADYKWLPWEEFVNLVRSNPTIFTKTVRLYCSDDGIVDSLTESMMSVVHGDSFVPTERKIVYASFENDDYSLIQEQEGKYVGCHFDVTYSLDRKECKKIELPKLDQIFVRDAVDVFRGLFE